MTLNRTRDGGNTKMRNIDVATERSILHARDLSFLVSLMQIQILQIGQIKPFVSNRSYLLHVSRADSCVANMNLRHFLINTELIQEAFISLYS